MGIFGESNAELKHRRAATCISADPAFLLDNSIHGVLLSPGTILAGLVLPEMTVVDLGCGPGLFIRAMARLVGDDGWVITVDIPGGDARVYAPQVRAPRGRLPGKLVPELAWLVGDRRAR